MNDNNQDPEGLYKKYKQTRDVNAAHGMEKPDQPVEEELVDQVYRRYQHTRGSAETEIDEIMRAIANASDTTVDGQSIPDDQSNTNLNQPHPGHTDTDLQPIASVGEVTDHTESNKNNRSSPQAANDSGNFLKYFVPAIAATLIVFFALPLINNKGPSDSTQNTDYLTAELAPFVEPNTNSMLGFSDTGNSRNTALNYGFLATDLTVLANAGGPAATVKQVVQSYLLSEQTHADSIRTMALDVISGINADIDTDSLTSDSIAKLHALSITLGEQTSNNNTDWFKLGQAIESIGLTAQLALATDDTKPLNSALDHGSSLTVSNEDANLKKQIDALFTETVQDAMPPAELRRIITKANDIKSVVQ